MEFIEDEKRPFCNHPHAAFIMILHAEGGHLTWKSSEPP
jgi:hypothetical protein